MKFSASLVALTLATFAMAQRSYIGLPANGTQVKAGKKLVVQIVRPVSIEGSIEVGIVIGLQSCRANNSASCAPPQDEVGLVLFNGKYKPERHEVTNQPYENFTVHIPADNWEVDVAELTVNRFHMIGAGPAAVLESNNVTLQIKL